METCDLAERWEGEEEGEGRRRGKGEWRGGCGYPVPLNANKQIKNWPCKT